MNPTASTRRGLLAVALVGLTALAAASTSEATVVTWRAQQHITDGTDVSTNGMLIGAYTLRPDALQSWTVNGVTFEPFVIRGGPTSVTVGDFTLACFASFMTSNFLPGGSNPPFSDLPESYRRLVQAYGSSRQGPLLLTMSGLTVGETYEFQWWASGGGAGVVSALAGNIVSLDYNAIDALGGLGQFALGTFTADETSQEILFLSSYPPGLNFTETSFNAFQLRAVPEPMGAALLLLGSLALGSGRGRWSRARANRTSTSVKSTRV